MFRIESAVHAVIAVGNETWEFGLEWPCLPHQSPFRGLLLSFTIIRIRLALFVYLSSLNTKEKELGLII